MTRQPRRSTQGRLFPYTTLFRSRSHTTPPIRGNSPATREFLLAGRSEEHTSELQSPFLISYAVFCLKKKTADASQRCRRADFCPPTRRTTRSRPEGKWVFCLIYLSPEPNHGDLNKRGHSFPTRRSSD